MPGYVQEFTKAVEAVETHATKEGQGWDVRSSFEDNLRFVNSSDYHRNETHSQRMESAVEYTKHEISEAREIEDYSQGMQYEIKEQGEGMRMKAG